MLAVDGLAHSASSRLPHTVRFILWACCDGQNHTKKALTMKSFKTIALSGCLVLAGTAIVAANPTNKIKANTVVCVTKSGIEATHPGLNPKQLHSLGCSTVSTDLRVDVLPSSGRCDPYLFVAATLPDKVLRYWIRRDKLNDEDGVVLSSSDSTDRVPNAAGEDVDCRD